MTTKSFPNNNDQKMFFFRSPAFILFWISSLLSNIGTWMQQVAQPWLVLTLTNSPLWVGIDSFAMNAPVWIFTLWGGYLADMFDRKKTILVFQAIQFVCVLTMVLLLWLGWLRVGIIVFLSFIVGLTESLSMPSFQTIIPSIVDKAEIPRAVSLNSMQFNLSRILGPSIAAIVIVKFGALVCFGANAISFLPFFISVYLIYPKYRIGAKERLDSNLPAKKSFKALIQAFRQLVQNPDVSFPLLAIFVNGLFCSPIITFCSVVIKNWFQSEVGNYGGAMAAFGIGGLLSAALIAMKTPKWFQSKKSISIVSILMGIILLLIAYNRSYYLLIILLTSIGALLTGLNISINSYLQTNSTEAERGKTSSLYQLALAGGMSLGALLTAFTIDRFSVLNALLINATVIISFHLFRLTSRN